MKKPHISKISLIVTGTALVLAIALVCVLVLSGSGPSANEHPNADASTVQGQLEALGASDATFVENRPYDVVPGVDTDRTGETYDLYHSESTGCDYYIDPDFGTLEQIWNDAAFDTLPEETDLD